MNFQRRLKTEIPEKSKTSNFDLIFCRDVKEHASNLSSKFHDIS